MRGIRKAEKVLYINKKFWELELDPNISSGASRQTTVLTS